MVALRDIKAEEEVTYDYCTSEMFDMGLEDCCCGSHLCRKKIYPTDWKKKELQEKYNGYFIPYLQRIINKSNK